jgi:cardiolipin synthase A/B
MVTVGSTNSDTRSFELNDEASLNVYDTTFAADMTRLFESDLSRATRYRLENWRSRPLTQKLPEEVLLPLRGQL